MSKVRPNSGIYNGINFYYPSSPNIKFATAESRMIKSGYKYRAKNWPKQEKSVEKQFRVDGFTSARTFENALRLYFHFT